MVLGSTRFARETVAAAAVISPSLTFLKSSFFEVGPCSLGKEKKKSEVSAVSILLCQDLWLPAAAASGSIHGSGEQIGEESITVINAIKEQNGSQMQPK